MSLKEGPGKPLRHMARKQDLRTRSACLALHFPPPLPPGGHPFILTHSRVLATIRLSTDNCGVRPSWLPCRWPLPEERNPLFINALGLKEGRQQMADIKFNCPSCMQSLEAPPEMAGQLVDCPTCRNAIEIPQPHVPSRPPPQTTCSPPRQSAAFSPPQATRKPNAGRHAPASRAVIPLPIRAARVARSESTAG